MHIGYCSPAWPPAGAANGIVSYVAATREYLLGRGHSVSVIAGGRLYTGDGAQHVIDSADGWERYGAEVDRRLDRWRGHLPGVARHIARQVRAARRIAPIDIVEMEESFGWSLEVQRSTGVPVVTRLHGPNFLRPARSAERGDRDRCRAEARAIRGARALSAPTRMMLEATCTHYGRAADRGNAVIPNPIAVAPPAARWRLDTCERDHILFVGRFDYLKGADTVLAAFESVLAQRPGATLTIVGSDLGMPVPGGEVLGFGAYARRYVSPEARDAIRFLGVVPPAQVADLRRAAQVTVLASRNENLPYSLLEALAAGCPLISTQWAGSAEIVANDVTGLLTPVGDSHAMAQAICRLLASPDKAARVGAAALDQCRKAYSPEAVGARLEAFYERTLRAVAA